MTLVGATLFAVTLCTLQDEYKQGLAQDQEKEKEVQRMQGMRDILQREMQEAKFAAQRAVAAKDEQRACFIATAKRKVTTVLSASVPKKHFAVHISCLSTKHKKKSLHRRSQVRHALARIASHQVVCCPDSVGASSSGALANLVGAFTHLCTYDSSDVRTCTCMIDVVSWCFPESHVRG